MLPLIHQLNQYNIDDHSLIYYCIILFITGAILFLCSIGKTRSNKDRLILSDQGIRYQGSLHHLQCEWYEIVAYEICYLIYINKHFNLWTLLVIQMRPTLQFPMGRRHILDLSGLDTTQESLLQWFKHHING